VTVPDPAPLLVIESVNGSRLKVAVTEVAVLTVTAQVPVPEHAPLQPANDEPAAGVAVSVLVVPGVTDCEQVAPQLMPAGLLVTVPEPAPLLVTESVTGSRLKVAVTEVVALTVTAQVPVPEHAPLQPAKEEPAAGVAVRVIAVPGVSDCEQVAPQLIPAGLLLTAPVPVPVLVTENVTGTRANVAVTEVAALTVTAQLPVPEHAPLQPANDEPAAGVAVRVIAVPGVSDCEQVAPQVMPAGLLVTVPDPAPLLVTESVTGTRVKVAVTEVAALTVTAQVLVPEQAPVQPAKEEPAAGVAVKVIAVPGVSDCEQLAPQLMPAGLLVTVPEPAPLLVTESVTGSRLNVAVAEMAVLTVTAQVPVPEHAPLQPANDEPAAGVAVSVLVVPGVTDCEQVAPQLMPAGLLVTVPEPAPLLVTESVTGSRLKVAVTEVVALTVTAQVPVPEHAPLQPAKEEPAAGVAVRVIPVPGVTDCEQVAPQLIPAGLLLTAPVPVPVLVTENVTGTRANVAVTEVAALTVTAQLPVPEHAPLQPANDEPAAGVAVRVIAVPGVIDCEQVAPQVMPAGLLVTVPEPAPLLVTDSVNGSRLNVAVTEGAVFTVTSQVP